MYDSSNMSIPTVTVITANTTYNTPVGCKYIKVYIIGPGGAGGAGDFPSAGSGGEGGQTKLNYFAPGSYVVTFVAATSTTFNGVTSVTGGFGYTGGLILDSGGQVLDSARLSSPGFIGGDKDTSGNGGSSGFGSGGRGHYSTIAANGGNGLGYGGAGAGGTNGTSLGGTAAPGAVIVTEYY